MCASMSFSIPLVIRCSHRSEPETKVKAVVKPRLRESEGALLQRNAHTYTDVGSNSNIGNVSHPTAIRMWDRRWS